MEQLGIFGNEKIRQYENISDSKKNVYGFLGIKADKRIDRADYDFYSTDPIAIKWLMKLESLDHNIWEPACGMGHLAKPLIEAGYNVRATDIVYRGFGEGGIDFFNVFDNWDGDIVTNPPYKVAQEFIEHSLRRIPVGKKVCMFLKVQFLEGKNRKRFFELNPPKTIWVSSSRINCYRNGDPNSGKNSMMAFAWFVWEKGYKGDTIVKWFN